MVGVGCLFCALGVVGLDEGEKADGCMFAVKVVLGVGGKRGMCGCTCYIKTVDYMRTRTIPRREVGNQNGPIPDRG